MNGLKYFVIAESLDDSELPTSAEPMEIQQVGQHIAAFLAIRQAQGYFLNCNQERIPLHALRFRVVPAEIVE